MLHYEGAEIEKSFIIDPVQVLIAFSHVELPRRLLRRTQFASSRVDQRAQVYGGGMSRPGQDVSCQLAIGMDSKDYRGSESQEQDDDCDLQDCPDICESSIGIDVGGVH